MTRDEADQAIRATLADDTTPAHIRDFVQALSRLEPALAASDAAKVAELFLAAGGKEAQGFKRRRSR